jgi:very-short-patch-repair endonuclease
LDNQQRWARENPKKGRKKMHKKKAPPSTPKGQKRVPVEPNGSADTTTAQVQTLLNVLDKEAKVFTAVALAVGIPAGHDCPTTELVWNCQQDKATRLNSLLGRGRAVALVGVKIVENSAHIYTCEPGLYDSSDAFWMEGYLEWLRDASRVHLKPHVIAYRISGTAKDDKVNHQEAEVIASLIASAIEQPEYQTNEFGDRTSFGIVSLVGEEQALEIDRLLHAHITPDLYECHRILCGTAAQFQGDERDVVFLSVVDTPTGAPLRFRDQQMFKQRYNVAASRARDQMWVIHSLNVQTDLRTGDLRRRLIEHAEDPGASLRALENKERRTESPFEREVLKRLLLAGFRVTPQWKVGSRRIDLVVEGDGRRLAVECDGDRYHPHEKLAEDMERQAVLERLGWVFARIRGSVFFRDPERAMRSVFDKLNYLEIYPEQDATRVPTSTTDANELPERVIRRAEQIRQEWTVHHSTNDEN